MLKYFLKFIFFLILASCNGEDRRSGSADDSPYNYTSWGQSRSVVCNDMSEGEAKCYPSNDVNRDGLCEWGELALNEACDDRGGILVFNGSSY